MPRAVSKPAKKAQPRQAIVIGGGPAGLAAALELLERDAGYVPTVLEGSDCLGGLSRTVEHHGNRMDIGGHRFFSKSVVVNQWWLRHMPVQGAPARDDLLLNREKPLAAGGPDPEREDRVMLWRERVSRILFLRKFFDYPVSASARTFLNMGVRRSALAGLGFVHAQLLPRRPEVTLEDFLVNRFGRYLYRQFFEDYTQKVWSRHPSRIDASWGAQRIKGLSLSKAAVTAVRKLLGRSQDAQQVETSLIEQFLYPKLGPGQLWELVGAEIERRGGRILKNHEVVGLKVGKKGATQVIAKVDGQEKAFRCDAVLSSMPVKDLVTGIRGREIPTEVLKTALNLPYRDFMTVGLLVKRLKLVNETAIPTLNGLVPDTWIYVQERDVKIGRLQVFNNWSPYMVRDPETVFLGLEYFCDECDELWRMEDQAFVDFAVDELVHLGLVDKADVLDSVRVRVKKAYPAYFGTYQQFGQVREFLDSIPNLYCIGRNGQHRYNNQDHSMLTAFEAVAALAGDGDRTKVWGVNVEGEYHETKRG
ncbi:MAG TPA: NAD(P)/FAD-dependent oxidoreductase [Myxococcales bacterium]